MGGGNLQKSQMARERNQAKMGKEAQGGGGSEGMAKRHADAGVFAAAQAERAQQKAAQEAARAAKAEKAAAAERRAPLAIARPARTPHIAVALLPLRQQPVPRPPTRRLLAHTREWSGAG